METNSPIKTRTKAPYCLVYVSPRGHLFDEIVGYAYSVTAAEKRIRTMANKGQYHVRWLPVAGGKVEVPR